MQATLMLCDSAQVADGKLYILGGGWSLTGPDPVPSAIAMKIDVPATQTGSIHTWRLVLKDEDGYPVTMDTPVGKAPIEINGEVDTTQPTELPAGSSLDVAVAINISPLPLLPNSRYVWELLIDDITNQEWTLAFATR
jgi:hypothetical protein